MGEQLPGSKGKRTEKIECLKCGQQFMSYDRKLNRICQSCNNLNSNIGVSIGRYAGRGAT